MFKKEKKKRLKDLSDWGEEIYLAYEKRKSCGCAQGVKGHTSVLKKLPKSQVVATFTLFEPGKAKGNGFCAGPGAPSRATLAGWKYILLIQLKGEKKSSPHLGTLLLRVLPFQLEKKKEIPSFPKKICAFFPSPNR